MKNTKNPAAAVTVVFTLLHVELKVSGRNSPSMMEKGMIFQLVIKCNHKFKGDKQKEMIKFC